MSHPQHKTCTDCGHSGSMFWDFADYDALCLGCRAGVNALKAAAARLAAKPKLKPGRLTNLDTQLISMAREGIAHKVIAKRIHRDEAWIQARIAALKERGVDFDRTTSALPEGGLPPKPTSGRRARVHTPMRSSNNPLDRGAVVA